MVDMEHAMYTGHEFNKKKKSLNALNVNVQNVNVQNVNALKIK